MKKVVCFILLFVLSLSIVGCGKGGEESGNFYRITFRQKPYADVVVVVDEGDSLSYDKLPTIRPKTGYNVAWETTEFNNVTEDIVVEAVYQPKNYTVEYNTNGGSAINKTTTVTYDALYQLEKSTEKENLYFGGWYYNGNVVNNTGVWNIDDSSTIILNARWNYRITFIAKIEDVEFITHVFVEVGKTIKKENLPKVPYRQGFLGSWDVEDYSEITSNATVYAKYEDEWSQGYH